MSDLLDARFEAGIDLTLRNSNGKKMSPKEIAIETARLQGEVTEVIAHHNEQLLAAQVSAVLTDNILSKDGLTLRGADQPREIRNPQLKNKSCIVCTATIETMAFQGTEVCSVICEKVSTGEWTNEKAASARSQSWTEKKL